MGVAEIISIVVTATMGLLVWSLQRNVAHMDNAIKSLTGSVTTLREKDIKALEQKYNDLRADLPLLFVPREDFIRTMNAVDSKLDKQDSKLDKLLMRVGGE